MTPEEAEIIRTVFDRLKAMGEGPRDAEAEGLVEARLRADPQAGLALVRALVMTDRAQGALARENEALKAQIAAAASGRPAAPAGGGLFDGPWGARPSVPSSAPPSVPSSAPPMAAGPQPGPWAGRSVDPGPWGGPAQPQGGGFWSSALKTGAGVAGGLFAFEALKGLFGGGAAHAAAPLGLFDSPTTIVQETVNIFQTDHPSDPMPSDAFQVADQGGFGGDDDGGGFGGDDSWS